MKPIYERWLYIILSIVVAIGICRYNFELIPNFDIGLNAGFIVISCIGITFAFSVIEIVVLVCLTPRSGSYSRACWLLIVLYWLIVWGWCYWKCVIEANRIANEILHGEI